MTTFRKGDRVAITVEVREWITPGHLRAFVVGFPENEAQLYTDDELSAGRLIPRTIAVGDKVRIPQSSDHRLTFVVVAIDGHVAWIKHIHSDGSIYRREEPLSDLTPAPEESK